MTNECSPFLCLNQFLSLLSFEKIFLLWFQAGKVSAEGNNIYSYGEGKSLHNYHESYIALSYKFSHYVKSEKPGLDI